MSFCILDNIEQFKSLCIVRPNVGTTMLQQCDGKKTDVLGFIIVDLTVHVVEFIADKSSHTT